MDIEAKPAPEILLEMYRIASLIMRNDHHSHQVIKSGKIAAPYYSPRGQEIIPAAMAVNLRAGDYLSTIYRGTHDMIAKGVPLKELWAEVAGRTTGTSKGKGGPMHITHPASGCMVTTGIVGSSMPIANGLAWASQLSGDGRVTIATFGDGASNIGAFHESLNLASLWKLPVVFICQNNQYGEHSSYATTTSVARISDRSTAYGMPGIHLDGNDPLAMYAAARTAIERARNGDGPTLIEAMTFRFKGHVLGDADGYMDKEAKTAALAADPVKRFRQYLLDEGIAAETQLAAMEADADRQITEAIEFALASPWPSCDELRKDVYADEVPS
ncbi:MAG TPA: thiamine pyrophosphate-dependent dehydrogenase E1 component subunit alpha [Pseudomonas sp.]|nr:thiamine pyrophosphate-dependent dehydrogenase E1 component subunit alpha [Pseudomonas sp.]